MIEEYTKYIDENGHCRLPEGLKEIEDGAFYGCENLQSITISDSVTSIGWKAFYNCDNLISITIPNSVTSIGNYAFAFCINLTSIEIPNSVTSIGNYAFQGCESLKLITIPNGVKIIGYCAFFNCINLHSITIPENIESIDREAFCGCINLTSITIFGKNKNIDWVKSLMIPAMCKVKIIQEEAKPLTELSKQIHKNAVKHGWWERKVDFPITVALCHAELSEALEEYRSGNPNFYYVSNGFKSEDIDEIGEEKPEGIAVEMIDCVIRILDWCGNNGIDVDRLVELKNEYNKTRSYRHGGKVC